ncbi:bone morphogenetic protein 10-like [Dreissena polymorpha]|uniref:TGF-beta family profile domain-containing protein n=1 Tax=Dreissena polymorpha TaxID=45954 RepID=A0A9D4LV81_DREPO|nr:bone morphogenetic protein 10-like [Dreissena polymorpha]KAH3864429.1 hypothetical protein DPMN_027447 [Dreissena polymorpha]
MWHADRMLAWLCAHLGDDPSTADDIAYTLAMHRTFVISGITIFVIWSVIVARPIMLRLDTGSGVTLASNRKTSSGVVDHNFVEIGDIDLVLAEEEADEDFIAPGAMAEYLRTLDTHKRKDSTGYINRTVTPEFMLELYDKLSKHRYNLHDSNIVRSFKNINPKGAGVRYPPVSGLWPGEAVHSLTFDISALDRTENVNLAELRLYTVISKDPRKQIGVSITVTIFEIVDVSDQSTSQVKYNKLTTKYIYFEENSWESFDVTNAVKRSLQSASKIEKFEIRISGIFLDTSRGSMGITLDPQNAKQPILVVYSTDSSESHIRNAERHDLLMHDMATRGNLHATSRLTSREAVSSRKFSRQKRSNEMRPICKRRPMYIDFEELHMHEWVIAPRGYKAYQCAGACYYPLSDHQSPSMHAIMQSRMHVLNPHLYVEACCVPTKLAPISLLYLDKQDVVVFKPAYEGMVVEECGCR